MRVPLLLVLVLAACRTATRDRSAAWDYVRAKYDRNRDGVVASTEYDRGEDAFGRLDRDGDGRVTGADFDRAGPMSVFATEMMLYRLFQGDDAPRDLTRDELRGGFATHDADADGDLEAFELEGALARAPGAMPPGMDPHALLREAVDRDRDGSVRLDELEAFHRARDEDGDGRWERRRPEEETARPPSGVAPGEPAPDFTLRPPDGGAPVTLSALRGRPVALVFGSYT